MISSDRGGDTWGTLAVRVPMFTARAGAGDDSTVTDRMQT